MDPEPVTKPELVIFSENVIGGVQSYYYNLLRHDVKNQFSKRWILAEDKFNNNPKPKKPFNTGYEKVFSYQSDIPFFHILEKLQKFVSNDPGFVLTSFPLELAVLHVYRKSKKTIGFICHDEYFLQYAKKYDFLIDVFIVHNPHFLDVLIKLLPHRQNDVIYLPYGIELPNRINELNTEEPLKIISITRLQKSKGVLDIPLIIEELQKREIPFELTIVGDGPERENLVERMKYQSYISFATPATTVELMEIIQKNDLFLLPSYLDGMPVSLMETMCCGLVPVISDFNEGIRQIVTADKGFVLPKGNIIAFASVIEELHKNRELLSKLRKATLFYAKNQFDVTVKAREYYQFFEKYKQLKKKTRYKYISYGSILDHPAIPLLVRKFIYRIINLKRKIWK